MDEEFMNENEDRTKYEYLKEKLKVKDKYYFIDKKQGIEILSKEVYKKKKEEIHYPYRRDGKKKYSFSKIIYRNMPNTLPVGIIKSPNYGYGFTKEINPLIYKLQDEFPKLGTVIVDYKGSTKIIDDTTIQLSYKDIKLAREKIVPMLNKQSKEKSVIVTGILNNIFPGKFEVDKKLSE